MTKAIPRALVTVLIVSGIFLPETLGQISTDYSSVRNYLSELGAIGATFSSSANYFGFLPVGVVSAALVFVLWHNLPKQGLVKLGLIFLLGVSIGYLGAFFFPCDAGCPSTGSDRQAIHNLAGLVEYLGAVAGLYLLYFGLRSHTHNYLPQITLGVACVVVVGVSLMFMPEYAAIRGVSQRIADYAIFIWLSLAVLMSLNKLEPELTN